MEMIGKYLKIEFFEKSATGKTDIYYVFNHSGEKLGEIKWYAHWRKYVFYSEGGIIADDLCLSDIQLFLSELKKERKAKNG